MAGGQLPAGRYIIKNPSDITTIGRYQIYQVAGLTAHQANNPDGFEIWDGPVPTAGWAASETAKLNKSLPNDGWVNPGANSGGGGSSGGSGGGTRSHGGHGGKVTPHSWAVSFLTAIGAPVTAPNVLSVVSWEAIEGGNWHNTASFNPLNTSQPEPGSTPIGGNGSGVQSYDSWSTGMQATVQTLENGSYNDVLASLRSGKGLIGKHLHGLSVWSGGSYSSLQPRANYGGGPGASIGTAANTSADPTTCAVALPSVHLWLFFGPSVGGQCLLTKSELRGLLGTVIGVAGGFLMLYGTALLLGTSRPAMQVVQYVVGAGSGATVRKAGRQAGQAAGP